MQMSFWFGTSLEQFLFDGCNITTLLGFILTCIALVSFAVTFELLKLTVQKLAVKQKSNLKSIMHNNVCPSECHASVGVKKENPKRYGQLVQLLLYTLQNIMGYLLMLAVMSYNGYFTLSVVMGSGLGYLLFGQGFMALQLKNAALRNDCPGCKDCGEMQQAKETVATLSEQGPGLYTVLNKYSETENEETGHILETCRC